MMIRDQAGLHKHLDGLRKRGETDKALADRLGIHVNTITKLKHGTGMFETIGSMKALGLRVVYETAKKEKVQ